MLCPYCGGKMGKGILQGGRRLVFARKVRLFGLHPEEGDILLDRNPLSEANFPAWVCRQCRKIIVDYEVNYEET